jgi:hypothetical protein
LPLASALGLSALLGVSLASPAIAQADDADKLVEKLEEEPPPASPSQEKPAEAKAEEKAAETSEEPAEKKADDAEGAAAPVDPAEAAPARAALPALPSADDIKNLASANARFARPILRRAARTAPDDTRRALALSVLARVDPTRATGRICARALSVDPSPRVRRTAAECLGRLPPGASEMQTPGLVAALKDPVLDVVTMAGWALANVGEASSLPAVTELSNHEDFRVARLFYEYALRLRTRHSLPLPPVEQPETGDARLVPRGDALISQVSGLEVTASTAWLAMYGGMSGWLHGGLFPAAYGGSVGQNLSALTALGGAVGGVAVGGAYGFFRARRLTLAHNVVQLGTAGTVVGYGLGLLSGGPPQSGINMASFGLTGSLAGTAAGIAINETLAPTPGALALGASVGLGAAVSFGALGVGYSLTPGATIGVAMLSGGSAALLTTVVAAPYDFGLLPIVGGTAGGILVATGAGLLVGIVETGQLVGAAQAWTPGAGWAVASAYAAGAVVGGGLMFLVPKDLDPFGGDQLKVAPPTVAFIPDATDPSRSVPVALVGGTF